MKRNNQLPDEKECKEILNSQKHLSLQSFSTLNNISEISPLTKEIMSRQATINIGTMGDVSKGKTTLVQALCESYNIVKPKAEKEPERIREREKNISQMLGYVNIKLYKCPKCPEPECYKSYNSETQDIIKCKGCDSTLELIRHIAFVDEPELKIKIVKLLNGGLILDGALLLVAANEQCEIKESDKDKDKDKNKQNIFLENSILKNVIILQNKIDTVMKYNTAKEQYDQIKKYASNKNAPNSPILPVSAQLKFNLDVVLQYISSLPIPKRDLISPPKFIVIHSYDYYYQGEDTHNNNNIKNGMLYGLILRGIIKLGEYIEIRPGICIRVSNKEIKINPIPAKIVSLQAEKNNLIYAIPGGMINIGVKIDPLLCRGNKLEGNIVGNIGKTLEIFIKIAVKCHLLRRLITVKKKEFGKHAEYITEIKKGEALLLNISFVSVGGVVSKIEGNNNDEIIFVLKKPVCTEISEKITISRKIGHSWRIIGWGEVISGGETIEVT